MCEELTRNISHLLMFSVILNRIFIALGIRLTHLHKVNTDAVVCERFTVYITNRSTNLQELFVFNNSLFVFAEIVV